MEKFLWNVAGVILAVIIFFSLICCMVFQTTFAYCVLFFVASAGVLYAEKRPVWLGV